MNELRKRSDEICKAHGLESLKPYQKESPAAGVSTREYRAADKGESWKIKLISAIDMAMEASRTKGDFIANMEQMGYGVKWIDHYKNITYTTPDGKKCRDNRLHDEKYFKERMEQHYGIRGIESQESTRQTVNATGAFDRELSSESPALRNTAGSAEHVGSDDNRSRKAPSTHAGANQSSSDMGGLEKRYSTANHAGNEQLDGGDGILRIDPAQGLLPTGESDYIGRDGNGQQQDFRIGTNDSSAGQFAVETAPEMDRHRSGVADSVIGAVVAL